MSKAAELYGQLIHFRNKEKTIKSEMSFACLWKCLPALQIMVFASMLTIVSLYMRKKNVQKSHVISKHVVENDILLNANFIESINAINLDLFALIAINLLV